MKVLGRLGMGIPTKSLCSILPIARRLSSRGFRAPAFILLLAALCPNLLERGLRFAPALYKVLQVRLQWGVRSIEGCNFSLVPVTVTGTSCRGGLATSNDETLFVSAHTGGRGRQPGPIGLGLC